MIAPLADTVARARKSGLDLSLVPPPLLEQARRAFAERDAQGFVWSVGSQAELQLVLDNLFPLRAAGIYEAALLEALTGTRMNHAHWPLALLHFMLRCADPTRFRAAGDPLPLPGRGRRRGTAAELGRLPHGSYLVGLVATSCRSTRSRGGRAC